MDETFIKNKIYEFFIEREGEEIKEIIENIDFIEEGILDSLDFFTLAVFIEKEFGVKLNMTNEETFKNMRRFGNLVNLILNIIDK
tara:strand:- start:38 stop:292 length:255 start_codon:yes stop_codon:yes gene_type:complete